MRQLKYISPSSLGTWEKDREDFYYRQLADVRPDRPPQENYMSIGSAFDAYVKAELYSACFGPGFNPQFEFDALFTEQVEEHNRDWAFVAGKYAFDSYCITGSYDELLAALQRSAVPPQFEFRVDGNVHGVPLMGKPDCRYITPAGVHVILDWKVNGFCSVHGATPYKYYRMIRDGWEGKASRGASRPHKKYVPVEFGDMAIGSHGLEETCQDWADQLSIYGWMLGEKVGGMDAVMCIDQLACKYQEGKFPLIRVANHCCRISPEWQERLVTRLTSCWNAIQAGLIYDDLTAEENAERIEMLEMTAVNKAGAVTEMDEWLLSLSGSSMKFRKR